MKAIILLGTLKKAGLSNTETLCEFLIERLEKKQVECETVKLVDYKILPGAYSDMGRGDQWPKILKKIEAADIVVFATPVWWGGHSSEIQRVIERLDEIHDEILDGKKSRLEGKSAGVVITGDSDGEQHIIGNFANFFSAVGLVVPPYCSLGVLSEKHEKDEKPTKTELLKAYKKDYAKTAETMADQLIKYSLSGGQGVQ